MQPHISDYNFKENEGLYDREGYVCDFNVEVIDKKTRKTLKANQEENEYLLKVTYTDGRKSVSKWVKDPRNIDYFRLFEINDSFLSSKAKALLVNKLLIEVTQLQKKTAIVVSSGFNNIDGSLVYAMGAEIFKTQKDMEDMENLHLETQQEMLPIPQVGFKQLLEGARKYMLLLPGVTEPLFFFSLFAVVKPFIEQLQIHCGFLLALVAPSGQLKTTLARLYCLWLTPASSQEIPIYASMRVQHILNFMDTMSGQNILVDDLRKGKDANERKRQEAKLDSISRHIDSNFGCANVILTGETMEDMGIFSCIDRILQIQMPLMDAGQVQELQKKVTALGENLMPGIALEFAKVLAENYTDVLKIIQNFYDKNILRGNQAGAYATRTHRHAMFIRLTAFLFHKYLFTLEKYYKNDSLVLDAALDMQMKKQDDKLMEIRFLESQHDYIADFYAMINTEKYVHICTNKNEYSRSSAACLMLFGKLYITSVVLKDAFFAYYGRFIPPKVIVEQFHAEGVLEEEPNSKGFQKNLDGRKHYVINLKILIHYLLRHGYQVSDEMKKRFYPSGSQSN